MSSRNAVWKFAANIFMAVIFSWCILSENVNTTTDNESRRLRPRVSRGMDNQEDDLKLKSTCVTKEGLAGICHNIQNCSFAIENMHRSQITVCTWQGFVPVVCCPDRPESSINALPLSLPLLNFSEPNFGSYASVGSTPLITVKPSKPAMTPARPWKPSITEFFPFPSLAKPISPSAQGDRAPIPFAGEYGRPKPSEVYSIHSENGSLLFTLRHPMKHPTSTHKKEMSCGMPSYSVLRQPKENQRVRPNSKNPDTLQETSSIVGGTAVAIGSFPWMAAIFKSARIGYSFRSNFLCAGSIIDARNIATAAHCFEKSDHPSIFSVRVGHHNLTSSISLGSNPDEFRVEKIMFHPDYRPPQIYNDLAILRLNKPLSLGNNRIWPICLPDPVILSNFSDMEGTIAGWGSTGSGRPGTTVLQQVTLPLVDNDECRKAYDLVLGMSVYFPNGISKQLLCAGYKDGGKDACQGDSGGPLMVLDDKSRWTLLGIVSVGRGCAEPGFPGLYTRITQYVSWMRNVTES